MKYSDLVLRLKFPSLPQKSPYRYDVAEETVLGEIYYVILINEERKVKIDPGKLQKFNITVTLEGIRQSLSVMKTHEDFKAFVKIAEGTWL